LINSELVTLQEMKGEKGKQTRLQLL